MARRRAQLGHRLARAFNAERPGAAARRYPNEALADQDG
jgi:hypothetical protein